MPLANANVVQWGKDRPATGQFDQPFSASSQPPTPFHTASPGFGNFPQYGNSPMSPQSAGQMGAYPGGQTGHGGYGQPGASGVSGYGQSQGNAQFMQSPASAGMGRGFGGGGPEFHGGGYGQQGYPPVPASVGGYGQGQQGSAAWTNQSRGGGQNGSTGNASQYGAY